MSKKKPHEFTKQFDKRVDIVTKDNNSYHITKTRMYICASGNESDHYGKYYTITSNKYNKNNVHIITEFYDSASDNNRLRFRILNLHDVEKFKTIEKLPNGNERKIAVIKYKDASEYVCSIGKIKSIKSDIPVEKPKPIIDLKNNKILKLKEEHSSGEEEIKKAA